MTAHQKEEAELLATLKGLKGAPRRRAAEAGVDRPESSHPTGTPNAAYEAISATYWSERRPSPMDLILDQYWRGREVELARKVRPESSDHDA